MKLLQPKKEKVNKRKTLFDPNDLSMKKKSSRGSEKREASKSRNSSAGTESGGNMTPSTKNKYKQ
jgi:hypothetical protein